MLLHLLLVVLLSFDDMGGAFAMTLPGDNGATAADAMHEASPPATRR